MRNLGGATAETMEKSTHGWPGKYTMCFAENAESGLGDLETLVSSMRWEGISGYYYQARGTSPIIVLGPEHTAEIATAGFSRKKVRGDLPHHSRDTLRR